MTWTVVTRFPCMLVIVQPVHVACISMKLLGQDVLCPGFVCTPVFFVHVHMHHTMYC